MVPDIGQRYGPYEILSRIGGGGMGHVFRAWDARLHREVAIKLLHNEFSMPGMRERFLREARAASALNHPNICTIFDIGEQRGDPYLVMEMLQGITLKDRIQYEAIPVDQLICIAREVAEALAAAHAKGVVHRDIKPANIFLVAKPNGNFQAKVLDFGLAKFEGGPFGGRGSRTLDLTAAGATVGTLAYMSPEQARGETLDSRSDLFSLGVLMYEMATRRIPFTGATSALVFVQLLNHDPEPVREWNEAIPRELEKIILKLIAKDKSARFQSAQELDEALARLTDKGGGGWLRKVAVPLVRAPEPVARERRASQRKMLDSRVDGGSRARPAVDTASPVPANRSEAQVLRPVARLPSMMHAQVPAQPTMNIAEEAASSEAPMAAMDIDDGLVAGEQAAGLVEIQAAAEAATADGLSPAPLSQDTAEAAPFFVSRATPRGSRTLTIRRLMLVSAVCCALALVAWLVRRGHFGTTILVRGDSVLLAQIENRTGDRTLDGVATTGLHIALSQSPFFRLINGQAYRLARAQITPEGGGNLQVISRKVAERLGAKTYIVGFLSGAGAPYTLHADMATTVSNDVVISVDESVATEQELPAALDRLAETLRIKAGEEKESVRRNAIPLSHEGTDNLGALNALSLGEDSLAAANLDDALRLFQQAARLDPQFIQAQLRLAVLYRRQRAEVASAEAAKAARAVGDATSDRTRALAEYEFQMDATGDYAKAAAVMRRLLAVDPRDSEAEEHLARTLRLEGHFGEALQHAQQAYADDPYNLEAYTQAQNSLIGLDRFEAASQLGMQVKAMKIGSLGGTLTAEYLQGRQEEVNASIAAIERRKSGFHPDWSLGLYLDNVGKVATATALWQDRAAAALQVPGLDSTAAFLLSQGAIDRALLGDCGGGTTMAHTADAHAQGIGGLYNTGMTYALCGDTVRARHAADLLQQNYPQSFAVKSFYLSDLQAAIALASGDPAAALEILKPAQQFDLISLTPILRGRAHVSLKQVQVGIVDFQTVLSHRGAPFIVGNVMYPVAQMGLARAFAATGDANNSAAAYRSFLQLWKGADVKQPMMIEAAAHSH